MTPFSDSDRLLVTGSSGFIGSHAAASFGSAGVQYLDRVAPSRTLPSRTELVDLGGADRLSEAAGAAPAQRILHLAAEAEVVTPWSQVGDVLRSNELGTYNLASTYQPRLMVFASTSAVYGNAGIAETEPFLETARPLGLYGVSKCICEILLRDWALTFQTSAVAFRLGNVVGAGCRGLIPYLVRHAQRYPDGSVPARMRGNGKLVRDYVPVEFVIDLFAQALQKEWKPGTLVLFNAGTGRGTSNGEVAQIVTETLAGHNLKLEIEWRNPVAPGEAESVVLNMERTERHFHACIPAEDQVRQSIQKSVRSFLEGNTGCA